MDWKVETWDLLQLHILEISLGFPTLCRIQHSRDPLVLINLEAEGFVMWLVRDDGDLDEAQQTTTVAIESLLFFKCN